MIYIVMSKVTSKQIYIYEVLYSCNCMNKADLLSHRKTETVTAAFAHLLRWGAHVDVNVIPLPRNSLHSLRHGVDAPALSAIGSAPVSHDLHPHGSLEGQPEEGGVTGVKDKVQEHQGDVDDRHQLLHVHCPVLHADLCHH